MDIKARRTQLLSNNAGWSNIDTSHTTRLQETHVRSDWDVNTDDITPLGPRLTTFSTSSNHRRVQPRTKRESRKTDRTTPKKATLCGTHRRSATATPHTNQQGENHRIKTTHRLYRSRHHDTQRAGPPPHPPLDSTSLVASPHVGASPRPPQHSESQIRLQSRC